MDRSEYGQEQEPDDVRVRDESEVESAHGKQPGRGAAKSTSCEAQPSRLALG